MIVAALDDESVRLLAQACSLRRVVLLQLDGQYPDPVIREDAARLERLAAVLQQANAARDEIEALTAQPPCTCSWCR